jgi:hypothetical protein
MHADCTLTRHACAMLTDADSSCGTPGPYLGGQGPPIDNTDCIIYGRVNMEVCIIYGPPIKYGPLSCAMLTDADSSCGILTRHVRS